MATEPAASLGGFGNANDSEGEKGRTDMGVVAQSRSVFTLLRFGTTSEMQTIQKGKRDEQTWGQSRKVNQCSRYYGLGPGTMIYWEWPEPELPIENRSSALLLLSL
jgi:hypothetical protein